MPAWSTRCCGGSRARALQRFAASTVALDTPDVADAALDRRLRRRTPRGRSRPPTRHEPALDLTVKHDAADWAGKLRGRVLPTGTVRLAAHGPVPPLPGFAEGDWWVQDAAAALPARLFGDVAGRSVADLCAAPGGKTAQLAAGRRRGHRGRPLRAAARPAARQPAAAAASTPRSSARRLPPRWPGGAVRRRAARRALLVDRHDPPPSRHRLAQASRRPAALTALQRRLLERAIALDPAGRHARATAPARSSRRRASRRSPAAAGGSPEIRREPSFTGEINGLRAITPHGDLRTLPCHWPDPDPRIAGLDGFFAARLERI